MNKIRIIDLLNKIANEEELPEEIIVMGATYYLCEGDQSGCCYFSEKPGYGGVKLSFDTSVMNEEVEIIEEDKPAIAKEELENRIENALEFLETQYNTFPSGEMWREALKNTLQGKDYDDVYVEDKKIEKLTATNDVPRIELAEKINEIIDYINKGDK